MNSSSLSISVVIPNFNGKKLLAQNLPKVIDAVKGHEIIVVDDCSSDDSVEYLKANFPKIKVVVHNINRRFAAACNTGINSATGDVVLLLNNDVEPSKDFLEPLISKFSDENVFAVGCAEINPLENNKKIYGRAGGAFKRGLIVHWRGKDQTKDSTLWVSGGSGAFRKSIWQRIGGMDPLFYPAYEEDRDICYRAMKRGHKVVFCPESLVYHNHETTNLVALGNRQMKIASYKNHLFLVWKNVTSKNMFATHLFWLPYHLIVTNIRSGGFFGLGFIAALKQLKAIRQKRYIEINESTVSDEKVLASFKE